MQQVKQMLLDCGLHMKDIKELVTSFDDSFTKGSIQDAISLLPPEIKDTFLNCLSRQNFLSPVSDEDSPGNWRAFCLESLGWHPVSRRCLVDQPSPTASPTLAPAPDLLTALSPGPGVDAPGYGPAPSSVPSPSSVPAPARPSPLNQFFPDITPGGQSPPLFEFSPDVAPVLSAEKDNNGKMSVVIAVVLTAVGTSFLVAGIFICYNRCRRNKGYSRHSQRDDRPLLSLSLSDFSGMVRFYLNLLWY